MGEPGTIRLELPWPPSVNHYYVHTRKGQTFIGPEGVKFLRIVVTACMEGDIKPITGKIDMTLECWPPDRRKRDLDNLLKALMDALQRGGCMADDCQVKHREETMNDFTESKIGRIAVTLKRWAVPQCIQERLAGL
jgi:crossover junction endodeoxyribonuclease RusA